MDTHVSQDLAVSVHEQVGRSDAQDGLNETHIDRVNALDWLDENRLAELTSSERFNTLCET